MTSISLSRQDIDDIARAAHTEVDHSLARTHPRAYQEQLEGVIDTITNRVASTSPMFGNTVRSVVNKPAQFSKIAGPPKENPYGSVQKAPAVSRSFYDRVANPLAERMVGHPSTVGPHVNYANIAYSDPINQNGWIANMPYTGIVYGAGNKVHHHGTATPGTQPGPYSIAMPHRGPANTAYSTTPVARPSYGTVPDVTNAGYAAPGRRTAHATPDFDPSRFSLTTPAPFDHSRFNLHPTMPEIPQDPAMLSFDPAIMALMEMYEKPVDYVPDDLPYLPVEPVKTVQPPKPVQQPKVQRRKVIAPRRVQPPRQPPYHPRQIPVSTRAVPTGVAGIAAANIANPTAHSMPGGGTSYSGMSANFPGYRAVTNPQGVTTISKGILSSIDNTHTGASGGAGGPTYLCTVAHEFGWIDRDTLLADGLAGQAVPDGLYRWYVSWAPRWANVCRRNRAARAVTLPIVTLWAKAMAAGFKSKLRRA